MVDLTWEGIGEHLDKGDLKEWLKEERAKDKAQQLSEYVDTSQEKRSERMNDKIIESLESMAEDMRAMGDVEKASGVDSALWLIEEMTKKADTPQIDIYPLTIVCDRYSGTYSGGKYTAWNMDFDDVPKAIDADDMNCRSFWHLYKGVVGLGATPNEAVEDLQRKLVNKLGEDD